MPYLDALELLKDIYSSVDSVDFVKNISVQIEGPILKSRLKIAEKAFIDVFFNSETKTTDFTVVKDNKRIFGIDKDGIRDWHRHPFDDPRKHVSCDEVTFPQFLEEVKGNLDKIK